ncbi:MAG: cation diffusion facilitator family transporter [Candidatus Aminicenantales bacterium]
MWAEKKRLGYLEGGLSVGINTALFALKFWVGRRVGSVAMVADAWHTLSDTLTSVVVILGFWMASRPADEKHHFGHGRAESVGSVVIGTLLAVVGFSFLKESVVRLINHQAVSFQTFAVVVFVISAVVKEGLAQFSFWAGKKVHSKSLKADAWHHRSDAIASGLIVIGAFLGRYFWWMDGVLGIGVSLLILYATFAIIREAASYLLGEAPKKDLRRQISDAIQKIDPSLEDIHHLHIHYYGDHMEVTAHLRLPSHMNVDEAHAITSKVEAIIKRETKAEVTIHIEPLS